MDDHAHRGASASSVARVVDALRAGGPASQASIARRAGLSPATVNAIVKSLRESGEAEVRALNKRESVVSLVSTVSAVVSVQVNVAGVKVVLFDFAGERRIDMVRRFEVVDGEGGGDFDGAAEMVGELLAGAGVDRERVAGIAVGMQGPVGRTDGMIASWARLQLPDWRDVAIAARFEERFGVPVVAENDANLAALAEWTWGAGRGSEEFLYVTCAAGVGGGIILDGRIYRGGDGMAGEIGHIALDESGPVCFCGSRGCVTTYASERSILVALEQAGSPKASLTEVIRAARKGEPASQRVLFEAGRHLGRALASTAKILAPRIVAIGGALGQAGHFVFDPLKTSVEITSLLSVSPTIRFRPAQIVGDETILGGLAAVLAERKQGLSELAPWMETPTVRTVKD